MNTNLTEINRCQPLLGTYVSIDISAELDFGSLAEISSKGFAIISNVQDLMSYHQPDSQLSRINRSAHLGSVSLHPYTEKVIKFSLELAETTNGVFDPTIAPQLVSQNILPDHQPALKNHSNWQNIKIEDHRISFSEPTHLDLGGIAKGYAIDLAKTAMEEDFKNLNITKPKISINAGGDLTKTHWKDKYIHIRHPKTGKPSEMITMLDTCLATSSYCFQGKKQRHIIDPLTKQPLDLNNSISIFSPSCMISDALTKVYALAPESTIHSEYSATPIII